MALVEQFGVGRWSVQLAAIWHWYLLLCIYVMLFILFVNYYFYKRNLYSGINKLEWSTIPACPSLMCSFIRGNIEWTNSSKICV